MPIFRRAGLDIAYQIAGEGPPVLLIHGFASTGRVNWQDTGWVRTLADAGHQAITFDNRGHGASTKLYHPAAYAIGLMAQDACGLLDHLDIAHANIMGYSMGARIAALLAIRHGARVRRAVLGGLAGNLIREATDAEAIARGLEAPSLGEVQDPNARAFRLFAEQTGSDLQALAACMRAPGRSFPAAELAAIRVPILVVAGELDDMAGPVAPLVRLIPGARGLTLARRNHMNAVGDRQYKEAVVKFLPLADDLG